MPETPKNTTPKSEKPSLGSIAANASRKAGRAAGRAKNKITRGVSSLVEKGKASITNFLSEDNQSKDKQRVSRKRSQNNSNNITNNNETNVNQSKQGASGEVANKDPLIKPIKEQNVEIIKQLKEINERIKKWYFEWKTPQKQKKKEFSVRDWLKEKANALKERLKEKALEKTKQLGRRLFKIKGQGAGGLEGDGQISKSQVKGQGGLNGKAQQAKDLKNMMNNQGLLRNIMPRMFSAIGSSIGAIIPLLLKAVLILVVAAGAAGLGFMLFKYLLEPFMDKWVNNAREALKPVTGPQYKKEDVVTDTGEKVFQRTDDAGNTSYVTEGQMKTELDSMSPEQREKVESGEGPISFERASNKMNVHSQMYEGDAVTSGKSIEEINKQATANKERRDKMTPDERAFEDYSKKIASFDEAFRNKMALTMTAWEKTGGADTALMGGRELFKSVLQQLQTEHQAIIDKIRNDKGLKPEQRVELSKMSPLFEGAFGAEPGKGKNPDIDTAWALGYDLPNGAGLTFDWGNSKESVQENRAAVDAEFGSPSRRVNELREQYSAKAALEKQQQGFNAPAQVAAGSTSSSAPTNATPTEQPQSTQSPSGTKSGVEGDASSIGTKPQQQPAQTAPVAKPQQPTQTAPVAKPQQQPQSTQSPSGVNSGIEGEGIDKINLEEMSIEQLTKQLKHSESWLQFQLQNKPRKKHDKNAQKAWEKNVAYGEAAVKDLKNIIENKKNQQIQPSQTQSGANYSISTATGNIDVRNGQTINNAAQDPRMAAYNNSFGLSDAAREVLAGMGVDRDSIKATNWEDSYKTSYDARELANKMMGGNAVNQGTTVQPVQSTTGTTIIPTPQTTGQQLEQTIPSNQTVASTQQPTQVIHNHNYMSGAPGSPGPKTTIAAGGSGGGGAGGGAVPPDDSGMSFALTRDAGRSAAMGTHT